MHAMGLSSKFSEMPQLAVHVLWKEANQNIPRHLNLIRVEQA